MEQYLPYRAFSHIRGKRVRKNDWMDLKRRLSGSRWIRLVVAILRLRNTAIINSLAHTRIMRP